MKSPLNMKKAILVLLLFVAQNYLITKGVAIFGMLALPFLILLVSAFIVAWYFKSILSAGSHTTEGIATPGKRILGLLTGLLSILVLWKPVMTIFTNVPDPGTGSDVIPQLVTLYQRFCAGVQPYYPLEQYSWHPFPVYMPLHWLPLGIGYLFNIDIRWVGFIFMAASFGLLGYFSADRVYGFKQALTITLPAVALYCFIQWDWYGIAVVYELIIAAYYLLLCAGLISGNLILITIGIIACALSRYTVVFWLPLFFLLLWWNVPKKKSILVWSAVILAALLLYVIPFYLRDPSILSKGIAYHNKCYIDIWNHTTDPKTGPAFSTGLNFSYYTYNAFAGDIAHRVSMARLIQAILMLALLAGGIIVYRKWKHRVSYNHFSLGMLYCFIQVFYLFSPFTYLYYYLPVQIVAAALCMQIILITPRASTGK